MRWSRGWADRLGAGVLLSLTAKQRRFVEEYCVDFNATGAAERAGYKPNNAYAIGSENLRKLEIANAITSRLTLLDQAAGVATASIVEAYRRVGFADVRKALIAAGIELDESLDEETAFAIQSVKQTKRDLYSKEGDLYETVTMNEVRMHPKMQALDGLAKMRALFIDRVRHEGELTVKTGIAEVPQEDLVESWTAEHGDAVEADTGVEAKEVN